MFVGMRNLNGRDERNIAIAQDARDFCENQSQRKARADQRSDLVILKKSDVDISIDVN